MILAGEDVTGKPLATRRALLESRVLPLLDENVRYSPKLPAALPDLVQSIKAQGLEGLVPSAAAAATSLGSDRAPGRRCASSEGQEFVIGGYTIGGTAFDAVVFGYYRDGNLMYAARAAS